MSSVLLLGAAVNYVGTLSLVASMIASLPSGLGFPLVRGAPHIHPSDYVLHRLFTAGTAFCFGSMYLYLYCHPTYAYPFLLFGMALKLWAFVASVIAYRCFGLPTGILVNFGCTNLAVATLFGAYLLSR